MSSSLPAGRARGSATGPVRQDRPEARHFHERRFATPPRTGALPMNVSRRHLVQVATSAVVAALTGAVPLLTGTGCSRSQDAAPQPSASSAPAEPKAALPPIKIGVLHSLSGT